MPLFDYTCDRCGTTKEYLMRNSDTKPDNCSNCDFSHTEFTREVSMANGGFYGLEYSTPRSHTDKWK